MYVYVYVCIYIYIYIGTIYKHNGDNDVTDDSAD